LVRFVLNIYLIVHQTWRTQHPTWLQNWPFSNYNVYNYE